MEIPLIEDTEESDICGIIKNYADHLSERTAHHLGYPYNLNIDSKPLEPLSSFLINNLGDPYTESNYGVHSRPFEQRVIEWFAKIWELPQPYWGYVTNSGTEGNLQALLLAREHFVEKTGKVPKLIYSSDTHYSVHKASRMFGFERDQIIVPAKNCGAIDIDAFRKVAVDLRPDEPIVIVCNVGTTMKGGVDDISQIITILNIAGFSSDNVFIHIDGALFGLIIPFLDYHTNDWLSFKRPEIKSVSVSGHKFLGAPVPCGVFLTRKSIVDAFAKEIEYLNSTDTTLMGSRNGHAAISLWHKLVSLKESGIRELVHKCIEKSVYLEDILKKAGIETILNIHSNTVVFPKPPNVFVKKWQLACQGDWAHVVIMPSVNKETVDVFAYELIDVLKSETKNNH